MTRSLPTLPTLLGSPGQPFIQRDLSWLQFNERVLGEAELTANPLFERIKFLSISASNLDEFFMIRFASLDRSISAAARRGENRVVEQLKRVRSLALKKIEEQRNRQVLVFEAIAKELRKDGLLIARRPRKDDSLFAAGRKIFEEQVVPRLEPPDFFNPKTLYELGSLQMGVIFSDHFWFRVPRSVPLVHWHGESRAIFLLDDLLASHAAEAFGRHGPPAVVRLTRDGDVVLDLEVDDSDLIPDFVKRRLSTRERGRPVRLQYSATTSQEFVSQAGKALRLSNTQVTPASGTLALQGLWSVLSQIPEGLGRERGWALPSTPAHMPAAFEAPGKIFEVLKARDLLLHHPYDSFDAFIQWIQEAAEDPQVVSIEQTIYRADTVSPVFEALKKAAKKKKVRIAIELRARFDEHNNLKLAEELREAGVEVAFGFGKLKLHAKVALVTRVENGETRLYTHLSTGNYKAATARQYTDLAILTANPEIGQDARHFFDRVLEGEAPTTFKKLVSAPGKLHRRVIHHIDEEILAAQKGLPARIVVKVNALVDDNVVDSLYRASSAGVKVDLIVRGACSLIPGVPGLSENIRVLSIVDRFLEHSRIYYFESARVMYLSSADWMPRNFHSRIEIAYPVLDPKIYEFLEKIVIPAYLGDTERAHELTPQGTWERTGQIRPGKAGARKLLRTQNYLASLAQQGYKGTPLE